MSNSPDYMNIRRLSGDGREEPGEVVPVDNEAVWRRKAIGPEDRYNDDFSYGQSTFFQEDPLLNEQYGRLLDMRYKVQKEQQGEAGVVTSGKSPNRKPMRREKTWHGDKFQELQMLDKGNNEKVLLTVQRTASSAAHTGFTGSLSNDKIPWSPVKAFEEIRKVKEAPPKNVVQHRLKQFEKTDEQREELTNERKNLASAAAASSLTPTEPLSLVETNAEKRERFMRGDLDENKTSDQRTLDKALQKKITEKVREFALKSEEAPVKERVEELAERESRNFRDLLSDFEKKSKELKKKEEEEYRGGSNYLLSDARTERRVFSDTETMMYDSSSDEDSSDNRQSKALPKLPAPPPVPTAKMVPQNAPPIPKKSISSIDSEDKYMPMTPPVSSASDKNKFSESTYLTMTPPKMSKKLMPTFSTSSPRASLTTSSTSGSIRSLHSRTPSQTLVMEHLQREFSDGSRIITEEAYVDMTEKARREGTLFESRRSESPRYCEIDESAHTTLNEEDGSLSSVPSHYEYLYQARTASSQHYESVYQEIPEEEDLIRPMDHLPDILGNTPPVDLQCAIKSGFEEDQSRETPSAKMMMYASDTFRPASFFLDHSSQKSSGNKKSKSRDRELPNTPKSTLSKKKQQNNETCSSPRRHSDVPELQKPGKSSTGLPPEKINLTYRSVYENETSSYSDSTDPKNSVASSASLNKDTDGSGGAAYYVSELNSISSYQGDIQRSEQDLRMRPDSVSRSRTPDFYLDSDREPGVARSKSLEGLLGDGHAGARDSVRVVVTPSITRNMSHPISAPSPTSSYRSTPLPARGREPPPPPSYPPALMSPEEFQPWQDQDDDENRWRESLRRASAEHKARSSPFVRRSDPVDTQRRSYSVCAEPMDPNYMSRHNFLDQGLLEGVPPVGPLEGYHSGRPLPTDPYVSLPNISSVTLPSGRQSVSASYAPDSLAHAPHKHATPGKSEHHSLPRLGAQHQASGTTATVQQGELKEF